MLLRAASRIPWQLSAAVGWSALAAAPLVAEAWERECPSEAAKHNGGPSSALDAQDIRELQTRGFIIGLSRCHSGWIDTILHESACC
jgi:hypothetical protein